MRDEELEYRTFRAVKYYADLLLGEQKCYLGNENFILDKLKHPNLTDARCLYRMVIKEVEEHNSKIEAKRTLLRNMKYKLKYMESNVFNGLKVPFNKIKSLLKDNPGFSGNECWIRIRG